MASKSTPRTTTKRPPAKSSKTRGGKPRARRGPARRTRRTGRSAKTPPKREPNYKKGDYVVHIQHGVAHICNIETKNDFGVEEEYFVLDFPTEEMMISVPTNKTSYIIRPLINKTEAAKVVQKLKEDPQESGANWSRWYKVLQEKMYSGDIFQVAEVVRDLNYSSQTKGISPALKKMLNRARNALITEVRFSLGLEPEAAETKIDRALPTFEPLPRKK